jgi:hypothetical protein
MICLMIHGVELIMNAKDMVATDRVTASSTLTFFITAHPRKIKNSSHYVSGSIHVWREKITLRCSILLCNGHCTHNGWPFWRGSARLLLLLAAFSLLSELIVGCCCANGRRCRRRKGGSSSSENRASTCWPTWERQFGALAHIRPDRRCCN